MKATQNNHTVRESEQVMHLYFLSRIFKRIVVNMNNSLVITCSSRLALKAPTFGDFEYSEAQGECRRQRECLGVQSILSRLIQSFLRTNIFYSDCMNVLIPAKLVA